MAQRNSGAAAHKFSRSEVLNMQTALAFSRVSAKYHSPALEHIYCAALCCGDTTDRKSLKKLRAEEKTSLVNLPACRVTKTKPFRDIWLVGEGEMKRQWDVTKE